MVTDATQGAAREAAVELLSARGVWKRYRGGLFGRRQHQVLRGATIDLHPGEVVGLVGENGSGKSTLMKILAGDLVADAGEVRRRGAIGYCPQTPVLYDRLTVAEHFDLFGAAYGLGVGAIAEGSSRLYEELDFARYADVRAGDLSGGTRSKLNLSLALLHSPDTLFLDEPYAGFDWDTYQRFWSLTAGLRAAGASVLIVSHFISDEERFDRVYDLVEGKTLER